MLATYQHERSRRRPDWVCLAATGCEVYWYASLTEPGHPVYLFDWTDAEFYSPDLHEGIGNVVPTLRKWL